jgi:hypothetical protein
MTNDSTARLHEAEVIVLSGNVQRALAAIGWSQVPRTRAIHDFIVAKPNQLYGLLRSLRDKTVVIVTKDLPYQRFRTIWKIYGAVAGFRDWMFVDEEGRCDRFSWWKLLILETPSLALEVALSSFGLIIGWVRLQYYRLRCR